MPESIGFTKPGRSASTEGTFVTSTIPAAKLAQIKSCFTLAEDPGAPEGEREAAMTRAIKMLAKYGIERAQLEALNPEKVRETVMRTISTDGTYSYERSVFLGALVKVLHCDSYATTRGSRYVSSTIFGAPDDIERVELLYNSLVLQAFTGMRKAVNFSYTSTRRFRANWLIGFFARVIDRIEKIEEGATSEAGTGTAIVLADRSARAKHALAQESPNLKESRPRQRGGPGTYDGMEAGDRADLGQNSLGTDRRALTT